MANKNNEFFKSLYDQYHKLVRSVVFYHLQNEDVHDVTQDIFIKVWSQLSTLRDHKKAKAWVMKITMNTIYDYFRKNKKTLLEDSFDELEVESMKDEFKTIGDKELVKKLLSHLSYKHREVVVFHYLLGMTLEEISESLNVSKGTLKSRLHYARERLMSFFEKMGLADENCK